MGEEYEEMVSPGASLSAASLASELTGQQLGSPLERENEELRSRLAEAVKVLRAAGDFIEDEADNREEAGSYMSDYQNEARDAQNIVDAFLSSIKVVR